MLYDGLSGKDEHDGVESRKYLPGSRNNDTLLNSQRVPEYTSDNEVLL